MGKKKPLHRDRRCAPYGNRTDLSTFLADVYSECEQWRFKSNIRKQQVVRKIYQTLDQKPRKTANVYRAVIDRECPDADFRQKSRWVRALQYAEREFIDPLEFSDFLRENGGISGCANEAARKSPKRKTGRRWNSWTDKYVPIVRA